MVKPSPNYKWLLVERRIHMEFKKIDDKKFQCLLFEEDLEENNILS